MESNVNKEKVSPLVVPPAYVDYVYNLKYLLESQFRPDDRKETIASWAKLINVSENMIYKYMNCTFNGKVHTINMVKLNLIANELGLTVHDLINAEAKASA